MNRRGFLGVVAALPGLGWVAPVAPKTEDATPATEAVAAVVEVSDQPSTTFIRLEGEAFNHEQVRQLIEAINREQRAGGRIIFT
jgi:hypothetical protein